MKLSLRRFYLLVDHTEDPYFPPIGNQDGEGSCVCWAVGYYVKTYQEAKEHGWDLSKAIWEGGYHGQPSPQYQNKIMSPDFLYHLINGGIDTGSSYASAIHTINQIGICSWAAMPYNPSNPTSWPSETAWREAPSYRGNSDIKYIRFNDGNGIYKLKSLLASGELAVLSINPGQYSKLSSNNNLWTLDNYESGGGHANTIVGYDDNFGPYTEEQKTRYGAFKVVNSWGNTWGPDNDGSFWISYEAMRKSFYCCMFFEDKIEYEPKLVSVIQIQHQKRDECSITLGCNADTKTLDDSISGGQVPFPNNKIVIDITEFTDKASEVLGKTFFLNCYDLSAIGIKQRPDTGTITYFSVEYYDDYESGVPVIVATSEDPPVKTINGDKVTLDVMIPYSDVKLFTDKTTYSAGKSVLITLENNGYNSVYFATASYWSIQKNVNNKWEPKPAGASLQVITQLEPGDKDENVWNQKDANNEWVGPGDYRVVTTYSMNNWNCVFTNYAYFSIEEKPSISFNPDTVAYTLTVTSVSPANVLWSDIKISGSCITSGLGINVASGDMITRCSGKITMTYIPTDTVLGSWDFAEPTTPVMTFHQDVKNNLLIVLSVDLSRYWSDVDKGDSTCDLPTGTIKAGDRISGCSGVVTLMWIPTNESLGTWMFIAPFTPTITFSQDDEHNKLIITNANLYLDYDINMDWKIDDTDSNLITQHYGETGAPGWIREDINKDGSVNYLDVSSLVSHYGESYGPFSWSDVDKGTSICNLPTGEISAGDQITGCSGTVILKWVPTNALLGSWTFTNKNIPPDQPSDENPTNQEEWVNPDVGSLSCKVTDPDGDSLIVKFYWQDGSLIGTASEINSGGVASVSINNLTRYATKEWYVIVSDGVSQINGPTWRFTVEAYDWDINRDGKVDDTDNNMLTEHYGETGTPGWIREDINKDGVVNYLDLSILTSHYGESYQG